MKRRKRPRLRITNASKFRGPFKKPKRYVVERDNDYCSFDVLFKTDSIEELRIWLDLNGFCICGLETLYGYGIGAVMKLSESVNN